MDDENKFNEDENNEEPEETLEPQGEEVEGVTEADSINDEITEDAGDDTAAEDAVDDTYESFQYEAEVAPKKKISPIPFVIAAAVIVLVVGIFVGYKLTYNPYNHMGYINTTDRTLDMVAEDFSMSLEEFLDEYGLPADMRGDTEETAAYYMMPVEKIAAMYGTDFATFAEYYGFGENVTAETTWGDALDSMTLLEMVGEENLDTFIEEYQLGDVTGETLWGDVRRIVDKKNYDDMLAAEATAEVETEPISDEATN